MKLSILPFSALLLLAGCDYLPTAENTAKKAVSEKLIDPDSAKFSDVFEGSKKGSYCGLVNAKNRMGAYVGRSPFIYDKITDDFGLTYMMREPLTDRDFEVLVNGSDRYFKENFTKIQEGCGFSEKWKEVCSENQPFPEHRLCAEISNEDFMRNLFQEFRD
jgi:hypothetical protein